MSDQLEIITATAMESLVQDLEPGSILTGADNPAGDQLEIITAAAMENLIWRKNHDFDPPDGIPFEFFPGVFGDGIHDDTDGFEKAAEHLESIGGGKLYGQPGAVYMLSRPIYFPSNTTLRFNGATVHYTASDKTIQNYGDRDIGFFNFHGELVDNPIPVTSFNLYNDFRFVDINTFPTDGYIIVPDTSVFKQGEYIVFDVVSGNWKESTGGYDATKLTPKDHKLLQITLISSSTKMFVDYITPYDFTGLPTVATVQKVKLAENIRVSDLNMIDDYVITYPKNPNANDPFRGLYVCGVGIRYGNNVRIQNVTGTNMKYNILQMNTSNDVVFEDVVNNNPAIVGAGAGYTGQFIYCKKVQVRRAFNYEGRHVIDFTGSAYSSVEDSEGFRMYSAAFQCHGYYDHTIAYKNTVGNIHTASGTIFGDSCRNFTIENHTGWIGGGNQTGLRIYNSKFRLKNAPIEATFVNCEIKWYTAAADPVPPDPRYTKAQRSLLFRDCNTDIISDDNSGTITGFRKIQFSGGKFWRDGNPTAGFIFVIYDVDSLIFDNGVEVVGLRLHPSGTGTKEIVLRGATVFSSLLNTDTHFIEVKDMTNGLVTIKATDFTFKGTRPDGTPALFLFNAPANNTNTPIRLIFNNCYFYKAYRIFNGTNAADYILENNCVYEGSTKLGAITGTTTITNEVVIPLV